MKTWIRPLERMGACKDALIWAEDYDSAKEAWHKCERGDWMLWFLAKKAGKPSSKSRRKLVLSACGCARLALPYVPEGEKRPLRAIIIAEKWAKGEDNITLGSVRAAADAAYDASAYAVAPAAARAAASAAYAVADAAYDAAYDAAVDAAYAAAYAAYDAAYDAAADAARIEIQKKCADIVREYYEWKEMSLIVRTLHARKGEKC